MAGVVAVTQPWPNPMLPEAASLQDEERRYVAAANYLRNTSMKNDTVA
jgi:hypothetical protein